MILAKFWRKSLPECNFPIVLYWNTKENTFQPRIAWRVGLQKTQTKRSKVSSLYIYSSTVFQKLTQTHTQWVDRHSQLVQLTTQWVSADIHLHSHSNYSKTPFILKWNPDFEWNVSERHTCLELHSVKAAFHLCVFYTHVYARKILNPFTLHIFKNYVHR